MSSHVAVLVGTRKGGFILESDAERRSWSIRGPLFDGWAINDMSRDPTSGTIYAGGSSSWYGPAVFATHDLGHTWSHSSDGLTYGEDGPPLRAIWNVTPVGGALYAGVEPAGLFRSTDEGRTWSHVAALRDHPSRPHWQPGNGGLIAHTIVADPAAPERMWVGISSVGVFQTEDGGATWTTRNRGVRADFLPDPEPEYGQCVHKMILAAGTRDLLIQQNHCGVFRTRDGGAQWESVNAGLPSTFGFPIVGHPRNPDRAWVIPLNGDDQGRFMPDGSAAVWRTDDAGDTWTRLSAGLPAEHAYLSVLREAMAVDTLEPVGVYFGTSSGKLYASTDEGDHWACIAQDLPPVWSVEAVLVED